MTVNMKRGMGTQKRGIIRDLRSIEGVNFEKLVIRDGLLLSLANIKLIYQGHK